MWTKVPSFVHVSLQIPSADWIEEMFLVFSEDIPSENLGFVDSTAASIDIAIGSREFTITQSPGLLRSSVLGRKTGDQSARKSEELSPRISVKY